MQKRKQRRKDIFITFMIYVAAIFPHAKWDNLINK